MLAGSGEGEFDGVVHGIESRYHVRATRMPFMGLVSLISHKATHGGVGGMQVAEIENFKEPVDGEELNRLVEEKLGAGWERMIRDTSRHGAEQTLIFAHPDGRQMEPVHCGQGRQRDGCGGGFSGSRSSERDGWAV